MKGRKYIAAALVCGTLMTGFTGVASAFDLGSVLKGGVISAVVNASAGAINNAINAVTAKYGVSSTDATKVVPIITVGDGGRAGAAPVSGPKEKVDQCKAALLIEQTILGSAKAKVLIPIDSLSVSNINRVQGVGVCASIDVSI